MRITLKMSLCPPNCTMAHYFSQPAIPKTWQECICFGYVAEFLQYNLTGQEFSPKVPPPFLRIRRLNDRTCRSPSERAAACRQQSDVQQVEVRFGISEGMNQIIKRMFLRLARWWLNSDTQWRDTQGSLLSYLTWNPELGIIQLHTKPKIPLKSTLK